MRRTILLIYSLLAILVVSGPIISETIAVDEEFYLSVSFTDPLNGNIIQDLHTIIWEVDTNLGGEERVTLKLYNPSTSDWIVFFDEPYKTSYSFNSSEFCPLSKCEATMQVQVLLKGLTATDEVNFQIDNTNLPTTSNQEETLSQNTGPPAPSVPDEIPGFDFTTVIIILSMYSIQRRKKILR
ncbi:MAG: hypothetical protein INQ03_23260 [Candidatus Heimdallarchaeota archaeon]|nr:hypothetical protein [Candidatus Heimdallarchaeota archaeon]